jgi:23S rRNA pseudouridine1911/1915/1917 synthase
MCVLRSGRPARTHYRRLAEWNDPQVAELSVVLETGRTHQIRVHLASIGHPLVGDRVYGRRHRLAADPGRAWLHATELRFDHPITGLALVVRAPLPAELVASLQSLGPPSLGRAEQG